jgi:DNA-binding IclR family transcriptional regulator
MPFTESEEAVLRHLYNRGDDIPANIAEHTGYHRKSASRTLSGLENDGFVENKGNGVYRLTATGLSAARELETHQES